MRNSVLLLIGTWILAGGLAGCGGGGNASDAVQTEVPRNVRVLELAQRQLEEHLTFSGTVRPVRGADLSSEESGRVAALPHDKGALVREGDPLVTLDRRLLEAEMKAADASRALAEYNEDRTRQLFEANSVSNIEMLQAETQLSQAKAAADAARIRYERAAVAAPFHGIVTDRYVELGQLVAPGTPVARIVDPYVLKLTGAVTEREVPFIEAGRTALVRFEGLEEPVLGRVQWVGFEADPRTGKFGVEIHIDNPNLALRPGVVGTARIVKESHADVIIIPRDAVVQRSGQAIAYVVEQDRARERVLSLGADQGLMVVVEEGLRSGDQLVVRGQREIRDGSAVIVQEKSVALDGTTPGDPTVVTQDQTDPLTWNASTIRAGEGQ